MMNSLTRNLLSMLCLVAAACNNSVSDQKSDLSYQAWEESLKPLFICDPNETSPQKIEPSSKKEQISILQRFLQTKPSSAINLTEDELKNFVREFDRFISLLINDEPFTDIASILKVKTLDLSTKINVYLTGQASSTDDSQNIANKIKPAITQIENIKTSVFKEQSVDVEPIHTSIKAISTLLLKVHEEKTPGLLMARKSYQALFGDIPGSKNPKTTGEELYDKYSQKLFYEQIADGFQSAIVSGFFIDRENSLRALANSSPIYRKFLQHEVENLPAATTQQQDDKHVLQSVLRSDRFTILSSDHHVSELKTRFGNNILIEGIARGSVAATYLISCRYENKDKHFVVKTSVDGRDNLTKHLDEELKSLRSDLLLKLYPGVAKTTIRSAAQAEEEFENAVRKDVKNAILEDVNFKQEAKNLYLLASAYEQYPTIKLVRGMYEPIKNDQYLFMEYLPGTVLSELKGLKDKEQSDLFNKMLLKIYKQILFGTGPFHADMHAGNIIVNDTSFTLIDAGRIANLDADGRKSLQIFESILKQIEERASKINTGTNLQAPLFEAKEASAIFAEVNKKINGLRDRTTSVLPKAAEEIHSIFQKSLVLDNYRLKKENKDKIRDYHFRLINGQSSDFVSAMRALNAVEHLYLTYIKPMGSN